MHRHYEDENVSGHGHDWVVLSDGSSRDTIFDGSESGFFAMRGCSDDGDWRVEHVPPVTEVSASLARVAVPQPMPPGAFKVVSYGDAFKTLSSRDTSNGDEVDEEGVGGVEDSDLSEDEEALDAIAGLWISYMSGSSSKEDNGDRVPRDGCRRQESFSYMSLDQPHPAAVRSSCVVRPRPSHTCRTRHPSGIGCCHESNYNHTSNNT
jgi:hypothetical protein